MKLFGRSFLIKNIKAKDLTESYLTWIKDPYITKYLELNFQPRNRKEIKKFLLNYDNKSNFIFGIYEKNNNKIIGTITLQIDNKHLIGYVGFVIGNRLYWGSSASKESLALIMDFGFKKLHKIWGVTVVDNVSTIHSLLQLGFTREAILRDHALILGKRKDRLMFGILKNEWKIIRKNIKY